MLLADCFRDVGVNISTRLAFFALLQAKSRLEMIGRIVHRTYQTACLADPAEDPLHILYPSTYLGLACAYLFHSSVFW